MSTLTGHSTIGIHAGERLAFEMLELNPAGRIRKAELFKNYEHLCWVGDVVYPVISNAIRLDERVLDPRGTTDSARTR